MHRAGVCSIPVLWLALAPAIGAAQQPPAVQVGQRVRGSLAAGDATLSSGEFLDTYVLAGRAGQRLVVRMSSTALDPYLMIRGPSDFSADNDDEGEGSNSARLEVRLPVDGSYRIMATSFRAGETGAYELEVAEAGSGAPPVAAAAAGAGAGQGGLLAPGQTVRGTLDSADARLQSGEWVDRYRLAGRRGDQLTVRMESEDFDAYLMIRGPGGFSEDNDDDPAARGTTHSSLSVTFPADGEYQLSATSYRPGERGAYRLSVAAGQAAATAAAEPAPAPAATPFTLGQSVAGRLQAGDPQLRSGEFSDSYSLSGVRGQRLDIRLESSDFDPYVQITGPSFSQFNDDDVAGGTTNSRLVVELPAEGTYRIMATSYRAGETGAYRLSANPTTEAVTAGLAASGAARGAVAATLALGRTEAGELASADDTLRSGEYFDRYSFAGRRGQRVAIDLRSSTFDAYLMLVSPGARQQQNDDFREGSTDSRIEADLQEDGTYAVIATSYRRGERGGYQLTLSDLAAGARAVVAAAPVAAAPAPEATPARLGAPAAAARPRTATPAAAGRTESGRLQTGDQRLQSSEFVDRHTFQGRRGQTVTVEMTSTEVDPFLIVTGPGDARQQNDDISASDRNARVVWTLPADGEYTAHATTYRPAETGAYALRIAFGAAEPSGAATAVAGQRVWGVFVGISDYAGTASNLPYVAEDATKLAETLRREGVLADGSYVLTDAEATRSRVRSAFEEVARRAGPNDVVLFFYSGHGTQLPENAASAEPDLRDEAIVLRDGLVTDDEMAQWFRQVHSRIGILALDACFSGGFARDVITRPGIMGLFSSEEDLTSAVAGKFQAGGYLAHFLRTGLAGEADMDPRDGVVTAGELSTYLRRQFAEHAANVEASTADRQRNYQNLVIERGGVKIDDVVLALPR